MNASLSALWDQRNPREKKLLLCAGVILGAALAYQMIWLPAVNGRDELAAELPQMRVQLAQMTQQASQAQAYKTAASTPVPTGQTLLADLNASLIKQGLPGAELTVSGRALRVDIKNARFSRCITWLDQIRRDDKLQVLELQATPLTQPGQVSLSVTLQGVEQK